MSHSSSLCRRLFELLIDRELPKAGVGKCRCRGQQKKEKSGGWTSTAVAFYKTMAGDGACPCGVLCYMCTVKYRLWSGPVMAVIGAMLVRKPDPGSEGSSKSAVTTVDGPIMAVDGGIMAVMAVGDFCQYFQGKYAFSFWRWMGRLWRWQIQSPSKRVAVMAVSKLATVIIADYGGYTPIVHPRPGRNTNTRHPSPPPARASPPPPPGP